MCMCEVALLFVCYVHLYNVCIVCFKMFTIYDCGNGIVVSMCRLYMNISTLVLPRSYKT